MRVEAVGPSHSPVGVQESFLEQIIPTAQI